MEIKEISYEKGNNSYKEFQMSVKISGWIELVMLNIFAIKTLLLSLIVFELQDKIYKNRENFMKKGQ